MKKILLCLISIFCLVGCSIGPANTPSKAVEEYLDRYVHNDDLVMNELDEYVIDKNDLKDEDKDTYKEVLKKQYSDLKYEITDEKYDGLCTWKFVLFHLRICDHARNRLEWYHRYKRVLQSYNTCRCRRTFQRTANRSLPYFPYSILRHIRYYRIRFYGRTYKIPCLLIV